MKRTKASKKRLNKKKFRLDKNRLDGFESSENEEIVIKNEDNFESTLPPIPEESKKEVRFSENIKSIDDNIFENIKDGMKLRVKDSQLIIDNRLFIFRLLSSDNRWKVLEFIKEVYHIASTEHKEKIHLLLNVLRNTTYSSDSKWTLKSLEII